MASAEFDGICRVWLLLCGIARDARRRRRGPAWAGGEGWHYGGVQQADRQESRARGAIYKADCSRDYLACGTWLRRNLLSGALGTIQPKPRPTIAASRPRPIITSLAPAPATTSPATTSPAPTPAETGIPAAYQGTWEGGIVYQDVYDEVSMSLNQGPVGTQVGQFMNDTLDCQASVYLEGGNGPIYLRLILTSSPENVCVPFMYAQATLTSSGLNFALEDTSQVSPSEPMSNGMQLSGTLGRNP